MPALRLLDETGEQVQHFLQHIEGHVRYAEELRGVGRREANVRDGEAGEVEAAEGEEFRGPDAEDDSLRPGLRGRWDGGYRFADEAHHGFGVVVKLREFRQKTMCGGKGLARARYASLVGSEEKPYFYVQ